MRKEILRRRGAIRSAAVRAPGPKLDADDIAELDRLLARLEARLNRASMAAGGPWLARYPLGLVSAGMGKHTWPITISSCATERWRRPSDVFRADIGIVDGRIATIGAKLGAGRRDIDADGRIVTPGGVDSHCHIEQRSSRAS